MTPRAKRLTERQRVLRKYPNARAWDYDFDVVIFPDIGAPYLSQLGHGITERAAWADAAKRLRAGRGK